MQAAPAGRRALVTGSCQGIGLAIAEALAGESCHLVLHGIASAEQQDTARQRVLAAEPVTASFPLAPCHFARCVIQVTDRPLRIVEHSTGRLKRGVALSAIGGRQG